MVSVLMVGQVSAASYREIGTDDNVAIEVPQNYPCTNSVPLRIRAPSALFFENKPERVQRLVRVARISLSFECERVQELTIEGLVDTRAYFKATASKKSQWKLVAEPTALAKAHAQLLAGKADLNKTIRLAVQTTKKFQGVPGAAEAAAFREIVLLARSTIEETLGQDARGLTSFFEETLRTEQTEQAAFSLFDTFEVGVAAFTPERLAAYKTSRAQMASTALVKIAQEKLNRALSKDQSSLTSLMTKAHGIIEQGSLAEPVRQAMRQQTLMQIKTAYLEPLVFDADTAWLPELSKTINGSKALRKSLSQVPKSDLRTAVSRQINSLLKTGLLRLGQVRKAAQQSISEVDVPYDQIADLLQMSDSIAAEFEGSNFNSVAASMRQGAAKRVETILTRDLPEFKEVLASYPAEHETLVGLNQQLVAFDGVSADIPGFAPYAQSVRQTIDEMRPKVCRNHAKALAAPLVQAGVGNDIQLAVSPGESMPFEAFVCSAYDGGNSVESLDMLGADGKILLRMTNAEGAQFKYQLKPVALEDGSRSLMGDQIVGDESSPLTATEWYAQVGNFVRQTFSGEPDQDGMTACDRFAADPHDAKRRADGQAWLAESLDLQALEQAIDACIAAVEFRPADATQLYQLGRMLFIDGSTDEARDFLTQASRKGYPPATHHLADIVMNDETRKQPFYDAVDLYRIAAKKKYQPAIKTMAELEPQGQAIFRPLPNPTGRQLASAFKKNECVSNFGVQVCKQVVNAEVKSCFQTKAKEFSCEWRPIMRCSTSASSAHSMILQAACNKTEYGFGNFRKNKNGSWTFISG